jgi:hypothetical protein
MIVKVNKTVDNDPQHHTANRSYNKIAELIIRGMNGEPERYRSARYQQKDNPV